MFAVVKAGGKQFKVAEGDVIEVDSQLDGEIGSKLELADVLMVYADGKAKLGSPTVAGAKVTAEVVSRGRSRKVIVFKKKRRQNYRRKNTHRQDLTVIRITGIAA
ncbi:MAG: 50S ribosomal protein L21 [Alphaproteobacteria bacterium]|nr:50S ribosomal protein L21 [Alphaproteobacteria bacterium]